MKHHSKNFISFKLDIDPKDFVQQRPRKGKYNNFYNPSKKQKEILIALCKQYRPDIPFEGAVGVNFCFHRGGEPYVEVDVMRLDDNYADTESNYDGDNAEKLFLDALQKAGFFLNDNKVTRVTWTKIRENKPECIDSAGTGD